LMLGSITLHFTQSMIAYESGAGCNRQDMRSWPADRVGHLLERVSTPSQGWPPGVTKDDIAEIYRAAPLITEVAGQLCLPDDNWQTYGMICMVSFVAHLTRPAW
jgi:hypothetical protein